MLDDRNMIFGDPRTFAIEAHHEPIDSGPRGFGRMALHMSNTAVGDITEKDCGLGGAAEQLREILLTDGPFWDPSFASLADTEIFALLDRALYVDEGQSDAQVRDDAERYARFNFLPNAGEPFDGYKSFIFKEPGGDVVILVRNPDDAVASARCGPREFRSACQAFVAWYDAQSSGKSVVQQSVQSDRSEDADPG